MSISALAPLLALIALGLAGAVTAVVGAYRYRDGFNPLTMFCVTQVGLYTVFSGAVTYAFIDAAGITSAVLLKTIGIASLYLVGAILPYLPRRDPGRVAYSTLMRALGIAYTAGVRRLPTSKVVPIAVTGVVAFAGVAALGGGGVLWLRDPRTAYQSYRSGVGSLYALTQWCCVIAQLYVLWALRPRMRRLLALTAVFVVVTYFLGSKNHVFVALLISTLYVNFFVRRIPFWIVIAAAPVGLAAHLALQLVQGTASGLIDTIAYFDYFTVTAQFIGRFREFGYHWGTAWLSSLWEFVPRALVPEKPHEYGILLIHQVLFPGAAEEGHTPGILGWALAYLDFGMAGVFLNGILAGIWQRASYEYFLRHRDNVVAFALMVQFSIWGLFAYAPTTIVMLICIAFAVYLRINVPRIRILVPRGIAPSFER